MSSKTLVIAASGGRLTGAVIESSIGSLRVVEVFDVAAGADTRVPASGPFDRVVAAAAAETAAFRILELPFRDRRRLAQVVGPALEEHVPFSLDDGVLAWDLVRAAAAGTSSSRVIAALAENSRLDALRARLGELGAEAPATRLVWAPTAILAAYRRALGESATFTAVDLGDGGAVIARFEAGALAALRIVAACDDELLIRNVAWSLGALAGDTTRTVVGGRHAARLSPALARANPALRIEDLPGASPVEGLGGRDWRELTALVGLVLAAGGDAPAPILDFEDDSAFFFGTAALRDIQSEASPLLRWGAAAAILAVLAVGLDYVQLFAERSALSSHAEQIYASAMPSPSGGAGRALKMKMRLTELTGKAETASGGASGSPLALLAALSRDVPKNLDVVVDQVEHSPPAAKVTGHAASFETVTKMQEALQKGGAFSSVEVKDVHAAVTGGGVEFLLNLAMAPVDGGA